MPYPTMIEPMRHSLNARDQFNAFHGLSSVVVGVLGKQLLCTLIRHTEDHPNIPNSKALAGENTCCMTHPGTRLFGHLLRLPPQPSGLIQVLCNLRWNDRLNTDVKRVFRQIQEQGKNVPRHCLGLVEPPDLSKCGGNLWYAD
jgi:hypothetical protein